MYRYIYKWAIGDFIGKIQDLAMQENPVSNAIADFLSDIRREDEPGQAPECHAPKLKARLFGLHADEAKDAEYCLSEKDRNPVVSVLSPEGAMIPQVLDGLAGKVLVLHLGFLDTQGVG